MDEAERLCDRVGVMVGGRVTALDTPERLVNQVVPDVRITVPLDGAATADWSWVGSLQGVNDVQLHGTRLEVEGVDPALALLAAGLLGRGLSTEGLRVHQPTLEDAFLRLTSGGDR